MPTEWKLNVNTAHTLSNHPFPESFTTSLHDGDSFLFMPGDQDEGDQPRRPDEEKLKATLPLSIEALVEARDETDSFCMLCAGVTRDLAVFSLETLYWDDRQYIEWKFLLSELAEATERGCQFCGLIAVIFFSRENTVRILKKDSDRTNILGGCCRKASSGGESVVQVVERLKHYDETFPGAWFSLAARPKDQHVITRKYGRIKIEILDTNVDDKISFLGGRKDLVLEVYARAGELAEKCLKYRPVDTTPSSDESIAEVRGWLQYCVDNHKRCPKPEFGVLPTRVIEIQDEENLKLMTGVREGTYAALSYCWGGPQLFALNKKNKGSMMEGFKLSDLPLTLQHGIILTRKLGLRYIWIDSLCIVQDDEEDKFKELPKMISVYRNAYITVASGSASCYDGFFDRDQRCETHGDDGLPRDLLEMRMLCPVKDGEEQDNMGAKFVAQLPSGRHCTLKESTIMFREEFPYRMSSEPISTRGWTFQERVLSPRLVLYGQRTVWTCKTDQRSAGGVEDWEVDTRSMNYASLPLELGGQPGKCRSSSGANTVETGRYDNKERMSRLLKLAAEKYDSPQLSEQRARLPANPNLEAFIRRAFRQLTSTDFLDDYYDKNTVKARKRDSLFLDTWHRAVEEYSHRRLSEPQDKLPAISGVAAAVQELTSATYFAGLWKENLLRDLLWSTLPCVVTKRPGAWRAPTWSWASCDRAVKFKKVPSPPNQPTAMVQSCSAQPMSNLAPLGRVVEKGTELVLDVALLPEVSPEIVREIMAEEDKEEPKQMGIDCATYDMLLERVRGYADGLEAEKGGQLPEGCQLAVLFVSVINPDDDLHTEQSPNQSATESSDDGLKVVVAAIPTNGGSSPDMLTIQESTGRPRENEPVIDYPLARKPDNKAWVVKRDIVMNGLFIAPTTDGQYERIGAFTHTIKGRDRAMWLPWKRISLV